MLAKLTSVKDIEKLGLVPESEGDLQEIELALSKNVPLYIDHDYKVRTDTYAYLADVVKNSTDRVIQNLSLEKDTLTTTNAKYSKVISELNTANVIQSNEIFDLTKSISELKDLVNSLQSENQSLRATLKEVL